MPTIVLLFSSSSKRSPPHANTHTHKNTHTHTCHELSSSFLNTAFTPVCPPTSPFHPLSPPFFITNHHLSCCVHISFRHFVKHFNCISTPPVSFVSHHESTSLSHVFQHLLMKLDGMNDSVNNPPQHRRRKVAKTEASAAAAAAAAAGGGDGGDIKGSKIIKSFFFLEEQQKSDKVEDKSVLKRKSRTAKVSSNISSDHVSGVDFGYDLNLATSSGGGAAEKGGDGPQRRLWVKNRSQDWWDKYNSEDVTEDEFRKAFQMRKDTFEIICNELTAAVAKENTLLRDAVPVRQRVAVCIWRLATGESLRLVSKRFGLGISTCHKLVLEVCSAIKDVLMPKYLQWPDDESMRLISNEFESLSGIPNVVGSMYTTHIPIIAPKVNVAAYYNKRHTDRKQKTCYSVTVQGVVDPRGVFTDVCIGWPGSMPDDQVLEKSALYQRANGGLLKGVWIVGGSGYPLMDWVLVPYTQPHLTWTQHAFNEKIGDVQKVSKDAFTRLKGRWSCLQKRTEMKLQDLPVVLGACCVLHNICEMRREEIEPELMIEVVDDEMVPDIALRSTIAMKARDSMAHNLLHHNHAGTSFLS